MKKKKILTITITALALIFIAVTAVQERIVSDIWLWLKIGKIITNQKIIPKTDFLSHTANGRRWVIHGWSFGVFVYPLYTKFGELGIAALQLSTALLLFFFTRETAKKLGSSEIIAALTFAAGFYGISTTWVPRPHIVGALFLAILLFLLISFRKEQKEYYLYFIPFLIVTWANTHASLPIAFVIMLIFLTAALLEELLKEPGSWKVTIKGFLIAQKKFELTILISFILSMINPNTYKIYELFFKIESFVNKNIIEWLPLSTALELGPTQVFLSLLLLQSVLLIVQNKNIKRLENLPFFELGLTLSSFYLPFSARRHVLISSILFTPFLAKNLTEFLNKIKTKRKLKSAAKIASALILASLCYHPIKEIKENNWGLPENLITPQAITFIKEQKPHGKMYNHFNLGSTLLWFVHPPYQVFIDGRIHLFASDIYKDWLQPTDNTENWEQVLEKYDIGWIIFPNSMVWDELKKEIKDDNNWCLSYWDDKISIILKRNKNEKLCKKYGIKAALPLEDGATHKPGRENEAIQEYKNLIQRTEQNGKAYNQLGIIYSLKNERTKARKAFKKAIEKNPRYAPAYKNLAITYQNKNIYKSIEILENAIKNGYGTPELYKTLAVLYKENLDDRLKAKQLLQKYKKLVEEKNKKIWAQKTIEKLDRENCSCFTVSN